MPERDPIPEHFASIEEAVEFWETHSLADYWDETTEVHFDVNLAPRIDDDILQKAKEIASRNGVSAERLINQCLREHIEAYAA
jgi:predicted HicB family RNase H-like nuclease